MLRPLCAILRRRHRERSRPESGRFVLPILGQLYSPPQAIEAFLAVHSREEALPRSVQNSARQCGKMFSPISGYIRGSIVNLFGEADQKLAELMEKHRMRLMAMIQRRMDRVLA